MLRNQRTLLFLASGLFVLLCYLDVRAAPPPDSDGRYANWFQNLRQPGTGSSCCSLADCRMTEYRGTPQGYEALVYGRWVVVPQEKILRGIVNPTGRAVVCAHPDGTVLCFVTPDET